MALPRPKVGWIGLGKMGRAMCRNLVANAIPRDLISDGVTVFNRTRHTAIEFRNSAEGDGKDRIIVADTANEAIEQSDIIFLCLSNDAAVTEVVTGALENARLELSGKTFVDCSTVHPTTTSFIAGQVGKVGSELVTCPVLGMPTAAAAGQVVCLLGGPAAGVNKILPLLVDVICRKAIVVSWTDAKMALALKLVANTFLLSMQEALAEGHTLAERCGVTADKVEEVLATILPGIYLTNSKMMTSGDYYKDKNPLVSVGLARKDASHALQLAREAGVAMAGLQVVDRHLQLAEQQAGAAAGISAIFGAVRQKSGLRYEN